MKILFVCLSNICRSPALEGTMRHLIKEKRISDIQVDSCGFNATFVDSHADQNMIAAASKRGIKINTRAKLFSKEFFNAFDLIFAVDNRILKMIKSLADMKKLEEKVHLATAFASRFKNQEIPDPYLGGEEGFELTMEIALDACEGILNHLEKTH